MKKQKSSLEQLVIQKKNLSYDILKMILMLSQVMCIFFMFVINWKYSVALLSVGLIENLMKKINEEE